jgi:hypothetical protein
MTDSTKPHATESAEATARRAEQHHARMLADFQQSLAAEGETAYQRWGLPLYHSLPDEAVEAQRLAHGVQPWPRAGATAGADGGGLQPRAGAGEERRHQGRAQGVAGLSGVA